MARDVIQIFIHLALDHFGAMALGRLEELLADVADPELERHFFGWAGSGDAPRESRFWRSEYPEWLGEVCLGEGPGEVEDLLSWDAAAWAEEGARKLDDLANGAGSLRALIQRARDELRGESVHAAVRLTVSGSLAIPAGAARARALLFHLKDLARLGIHQTAVPFFLGIGLGGAEDNRPEEQVRAFAARMLLEMESWLSADDVQDRAQPIYVVGDEAFDPGPLIDGVTQGTILAYGLLAATRSAMRGATPEGALPSIWEDPFCFDRIEEEGRVVQSGEAYDPGRPFTAIGAYGVRCPGMKLGCLVAARLCAEVLDSLSRQQPLGPLKELRQVTGVDPALERFLDDVERSAVKATWRRVAEQGRVEWRPRERPGTDRAPSWIGVEVLEKVFAPLLQSAPWKDVLHFYTFSRLQKLPLEDWSGAIEELKVVIERGVLPQREMLYQELQRGIMLAFLDSLREALDRVFAGALRSPVGFEPHRAAQLLLIRIHQHLRAEGRRLHEEALASPHAASVTRRATAAASRARAELGEALSAVASPTAVFLRAIPVIVACIGAGLGVPVDLGPLEPLPIRLALGLAAGVLGALTFHRAYVGRIRERLFQRFNRWFEQYQLRLQGRDEALRQRAYHQVVEQLCELTAWLCEGGEEEPPIPRAFGLRTRRSGGGGSPGKGELDGERLSRREMLRDFPQVLSEGAEQYRRLAEELVRGFQSSHCETMLPEVTPTNLEPVEEFERKLISQDGEASLERLGTEVHNWCDTRAVADGDRFHALLPFVELRAKEGAVDRQPAWLRSFRLPSAGELLRPEVRRRSSGFLFLETVRRFVAEQGASSFSLETQLRKREASGSKGAAGIDLGQRIRDRSLPPLHQPPGVKMLRFRICHAPGDRLAGGGGRGNGLRRGRLSAIVTAYPGLSALQVICYPTPADPANPMGRAWKELLGSRETSPAAESGAPPGETSGTSEAT
jgi:hypothetical protein